MRRETGYTKVNISKLYSFPNWILFEGDVCRVKLCTALGIMLQSVCEGYPQLPFVVLR